MKDALWKYGGYALFALAAFILFAWLQMPADTFRSMVRSALANNQAGLLVRFDSAEHAFPLGLTLTGLTVNGKDGKGPRLEADRVTVHPELLSVVTGRVAFRLRAATMGGQIEGDVAFRNRFSASGPLQADLALGNLNAAECPWLAALLGRAVRGRVDGRLRFDGLPGQWTSGAGHLELTLVNGLISLQAPLFGLQDVTFTRMEGNLDLGSGTLKVNRLQVTGETLQGDFQGAIRLDGDLSRSTIALRGDVKVPAAGPERFTVDIGGTVASPVVTPI